MVVIKEVTTKKDLKKFIQFPNQLYKGNKYYVPDLISGELDNFNPKKNPAYAFCETKLFLAYIDNKIVGRIGGLISHKYNEKVNKKLIRFTRFDFIDDIEVSQALINKVEEWGKSRGLTAMMGPIGFTDIDQQGMLIEGFEEHDLSITLYNYEYYPKHLEKLGFVKDADWVEFQIFMPEKLDERIDRISEMVKNRYKFKRVYFKNNKEIYPYAYEALNVINDAFAGLYGQVAMTDEIIGKAVKEYIPIVNKDFVIVITNNEGKVIGFGLLVPSLAEAFKKSKGKLFPFGIFKILKALKNPKILEMYFIAVLPEYQKMGVNAIIMAEAVKEGIKHNVKFAETGPELDYNENVIDQWKSFPHRQHRRRRSWIREIK